MSSSAAQPEMVRQRSRQTAVRFERQRYEREHTTLCLVDTQDLHLAFSQVRRDASAGAQGQFRVVSVGRPRRLRPAIREEAYWIGCEALVNAFLHSGASRVELELNHAGKGLRITVRDNGRGINPESLTSGSNDHSGLCEMQARAEQIGARFMLRSRLATGTEVELTIPDNIAFESPTRSGRFSWLHF